MRARNGVEVAHGQAGQLINGALPISQSNAAGVKKGGLLSLTHTHTTKRRRRDTSDMCAGAYAVVKSRIASPPTSTPPAFGRGFGGVTWARRCV